MKAKMQISVAGNSRRPGYWRDRLGRRAPGFTLLELLIVLAIVAIAVGVVVVSFEESPQAALERDALRMVGLLESARARAREGGVAVVWRATADGYRFEGLSPAAPPGKWLLPDTRVAGVAAENGLLLGPETFVGAQTLRLIRAAEPQSQPVATVEIVTDGLGPFRVRAAVQ